MRNRTEKTRIQLTIWKHVYNSSRWKGTKKIRGVRRAYLDSIHWACERCHAPAEVVHHRIELDRWNYLNDEIAFGWSNLEGLCRICHESHHGRKTIRDERVRIELDGSVADATDGAVDIAGLLL